MMMKSLDLAVKKVTQLPVFEKNDSDKEREKKQKLIGEFTSKVGDVAKDVERVRTNNRDVIVEKLEDLVCIDVTGSSNILAILCLIRKDGYTEKISASQNGTRFRGVFSRKGIFGFSPNGAWSS